MSSECGHPSQGHRPRRNSPLWHLYPLQTGLFSQVRSTSRRGLTAPRLGSISHISNLGHVDGDECWGPPFLPRGITGKQRKKNHGELSDVWSFRHDSLGKRPNVPFGVICWYLPAPTPHQAGGGEVRCCCVVFREGEESGGTSHSSLTDRLLDTPQGV